MVSAKKRVILHMMRSLMKLHKSPVEDTVKKAALQMAEDLWYQYLVIESFTKDEGVPNAKRKRIKTKREGQREVQPVSQILPPYIDAGGVRRVSS